MPLRFTYPFVAMFLLLPVMGLTAGNDDLILISPLSGGNAETPAYLIDRSGEVVYTWDHAGATGQYAYLRDDGVLVHRAGEARAGQGELGQITFIDWDGEVIWEYEHEQLHHDVDTLPNGNVVTLMWEPYEQSDRFWVDTIVEIDYETQEIIWEWHAQEHFSFALSALTGNELTHANSLEYLPEGNSYNGRPSFLVSFRTTNTVAIVDYETHEVVWSYGPGELLLQHDAQLLKNGNILVFDNRRRNSRVVEIDPITDTIVWSYEASGFFSHNVSGAQRLENGNTLITQGADGYIFEVTPDGEVVWEYQNAFGSGDNQGVFRAHAYDSDDIAWSEEILAEVFGIEASEAPQSFLARIWSWFTGLFMLK